MIEPPICLAMVLCQEAARDQRGLYSLFHVFWASEHVTFPAVYPKFCVYAELTNFHEPGEIVVRLSGNGGEMRNGSPMRVDTRDPLAMIAVCITWENLKFPGPGVYYVELITGGHPIQERRLWVRERKKGPAISPAET